jgi:hypothetical protein
VSSGADDDDDDASLPPARHRAASSRSAFRCDGRVARILARRNRGGRAPANAARIDF